MTLSATMRFILNYSKVKLTLVKAKITNLIQYLKMLWSSNNE